MGIAYRTINAWNSGKTDTPEWAIKMFDFFKMEVEYKSLKNKLIEVIKNDSEIIQSLHTKQNKILFLLDLYHILSDNHRVKENSATNSL